MVLTGEWVRPYENYSFDDVAKRLQVIRRGEEITGIKMPDDVVRERFLPRYMIPGFSIGFDIPHLDTQDTNKYADGRRIYYPIRSPNPEELVDREVGNVQGREIARFASGFGRITCLRDPIDESDLVQFSGKEIYPYGLFLHVNSRVFYSLAEVEREDNVPGVLYDLWKPYETEESTGVILVPADIPSLRQIEFKLSRLEPARVYEDLSFFASNSK